MLKIYEKAAKIRLLLLDVDGVLTDRKIYYTDNGHECKAFNLHDGLGIKLLIRTGIEVGIITTRESPIVQRRMQELGVKHVYQGFNDKNIALEQITHSLNLTTHQIAYVGDDLPDLPIIRKVALGIAVADALEYVRNHADWITKAAGGQGAVREVCELIMHAQGTLNSVYEHYL
ncbi:MAG TPA: 3-deoxy-manno-octulosonate-8-phosphatase KdsC [Gammaproteobacteria bacterium]|nr:3-deoxy-manno-octulosonate-8-phosphatase KdsC [Gammaproteobacteria bacterium]